MKDKKFLLLLVSVFFITLLVLFGVGSVYQASSKQISTQTVLVKQVSQTISASGSIHSQQEAVLHFQTGGKVVYLPFKQGDSVAAGQTIASLDTYALQKQLQILANAYKIAKNSNDQIQENYQATVLEGQTRSALDLSNHNSYSAITEAGLITDTVQRLVDNSLLSQNTAQLQLDLGNYAVQLASITAPFSGTLVSEDITTPNVNVTTTTSFTIADPTQKVLRVRVGASDIDFVSVGSRSTITLDGSNKKMQGSVVTIYPQKQVSSAGQEYYNVDIQSDGLGNAVFGQNGSVLITSNTQAKVVLIPTWTVINHSMVWVVDNGKITAKTIVLGKTHGDMTEVVDGLSSQDAVVVDPQAIAKQTYQVL